MPPAYDLYLSRTLEHAELLRADTFAGAVDLFIDRAWTPPPAFASPCRKRPTRTRATACWTAHSPRFARRWPCPVAASMPPPMCVIMSSASCAVVLSAVLCWLPDRPTSALRADRVGPVAGPVPPYKDCLELSCVRARTAMEIALRIKIGGWRDADRPSAGRPR